MNTLTENEKFLRLSGAIAAATTDVTNMTSVDMVGYNSLTLMVSAAAITTGAVTKVKMQQSSDDGVADGYSDLEGTSVTIADDSDNKMVVLEVKDPQKRYLKPVITRGTQNAAFEGVFAIQIGAKVLPVSQSTTHVTITELHQAPDEGTA
jgi:hypothetical protein